LVIQVEERDFIVGLPYEREGNYLMNIVIKNKTTIYSFDSDEEARYYANLLIILHELGINLG